MAMGPPFSGRNDIFGLFHLNPVITKVVFFTSLLLKDAVKLFFYRSLCASLGG